MLNFRDLSWKHPLLTDPVESFQPVWIKIKDWTPMGMKVSRSFMNGDLNSILFLVLKTQWGWRKYTDILQWGLECIIILGEDKNWGNFLYRGRSFGQSFQWEGVPVGLWEGGVWNKVKLFEGFIFELAIGYLVKQVWKISDQSVQKFWGNRRIARLIEIFRF